MPTTSLQLFPAKQTAQHGKASVTIVNHGPVAETVSTKPVMLSGGCKTSTVTGVKLVSSIHLNPGQSKTVHVSISSQVHGQVAVIFTPKLDITGFTQVGSLGAKILTDSTATSCVQPHQVKAVADTHSGGMSMIPLVVMLLGAAFIIGAAVLWFKPRRVGHTGGHRAR